MVYGPRLKLWCRQSKGLIGPPTLQAAGATALPHRRSICRLVGHAAPSLGTLGPEWGDLVVSFRASFHRGGDLARHRCRLSLHRIAREMRVTLRGLRLCVAEHLPNDRQAHSSTCCHASEGMTQIVETDIPEPGQLTDHAPWLLDEGCRAASAEHIRVAFEAGQPREHFDSWRWKMDRFRDGLTIGKPRLSSICGRPPACPRALPARRPIGNARGAVVGNARHAGKDWSHPGARLGVRRM